MSWEGVPWGTLGEWSGDWPYPPAVPHQGDDSLQHGDMQAQTPLTTPWRPEGGGGKVREKS